ncbi:MAG: phosphoribosylaminoimidazolesuccinocarboxamide synthase [Actinobacteria bacterium]|nr:phosphoribosylaminoimidazolesuccinocarboxamide synthase [Actinomycetota bacterium]
MKVIGDVDIEGAARIGSGKVREMFSLDGRILIVTTDRVSAFDYILPSLIPLKGIILNKISVFWFNYLKGIIDNHLMETDVTKFPKFLKKYRDVLKGRSVIVKKLVIYPIECVVRGYITGSGWTDYEKTGKIGDLVLPGGLKKCDRLPEPIFTPTTKEASGHDITLTMTRAKRIFGREIVDFLKEKSIALYMKASEYALRKGIIIADTKFEFGADGDRIVLADEALTPDSSRFWPLNEYEPGRDQKSFDKQFVRDYLLSTDWDRNSTPPGLPEDIVNKTSRIYIEAYEKLTGKKFEV